MIVAKKPLYQEGDILRLPVVEGYFSVGRILIAESPCLLIGFYRFVMKKGDDLDNSGLRDQEYLVKMLCGDLGLRKKEWEILGNIALEKKETLPLFWGKEPLSKELYLRQYNPTETNRLSMTGFKDRPTTEEEINRLGAQPDGLAGWKAAEMRLKLYLDKAGLL
jgi:hypothetical protein